MPTPSEPVVLAVEPLALDRHRSTEHTEQSWLPWFIAQDAPARFITHTTRLSLAARRRQLEQRIAELDTRAQALEPLISAIDGWSDRSPAPLLQQIAALPAGLQQVVQAALTGQDMTRPATWQQLRATLAAPFWRREWLGIYRHQFAQLDEQVDLRTYTHYALCWTAQQRAEEHAAHISQIFSTGARLAVLPPLLDGHYTDAGDHLAPSEPHLPYVALLTAYELQGVWDIWTIHRLFPQGMDVSLCLDVGMITPHKAQRIVAFEEKSRSSADASGESTGDRRAQRKRAAAEELGDRLEYERLHEQRLVVALRARDLATLRRQVDELKLSVSSAAKLMHPYGSQAALAEYFTTRPTERVKQRFDQGAPVRLASSHQVAVMLPWALRTPRGTSGLLWGFQGEAPIMFNPMVGEHGEKRAGHTLILGQTESGKTFASAVWGMRMLMEAGWQVAIFEPQGHAERFIRACGAGGQRTVLTMNERINVLDVAVGRDEQGRPPALAEQIQHVLNQLSILLGTTQTGADTKVAFQPRTWQPIETAILGLALEQVYAPWAAALDQLTAAQTPRLSDLCDALRDLDLQDTSASTRALREQLLDQVSMGLVRGPNGATYNAATTVGFDFAHDATAFDFTRITDGPAKVLFVAQALGQVNRFVRSSTRNRERPFVNIWDEFGYTLALVPALAEWASNATRTWRTFRAMLLGIDQDARTYLEGPPVLRVLFDNCPIKAIFIQDPEPAQALGRAIDGLHEGHVQQIVQQKQGECLLVWRSGEGAQTNEIYACTVVPTPEERRRFGGG